MSTTERSFARLEQTTSQGLYRLLSAFKVFRSEAWYDYVMSNLQETDTKFLNYGLSSTFDDTPLHLQEADTVNANHVRMVQAALTGLDLTGKRVLTVGTGRGGDSEYIAKYKSPLYVLGLDRSKIATHHNRETYNLPNLRFSTEDFTKTDTSDVEPFDLVTSIESSHPLNQSRFFRNAANLLTTGGVLAIADFRTKHGFTKLKSRFEKFGLSEIFEKDMTEGVLANLQETAEERIAQIQQTLSKSLWPFAIEFIGVPGSKIYSDFESGNKIYFALQARKN